MPPLIPPCPEEKDKDAETIEFNLVGIVSTIEFQKCLAYIETLHKTYPEIYLKPFIRPMLEFDWLEYVAKMQRTIGRDFWHLRKNVVVFVNKAYLGDDDDLVAMVAERFKVRLRRDYECLSQHGLLDVYQKYMELGRKFIYLTIAVNHHVIGHVIFMLYADLVPKTCERFIKKCQSKRNGFKGAAIHRIMAGSWIQFGGYNLPLKNRSCENYRVPHNRRGVLSMCNDGRGLHNASQFFVCLNPTDWMDYRYVAFGQMVQGNNVLQELETKSTFYEHPKPDGLLIADCGQITLDSTVKARHIRAIDMYIEKRDESAGRIIDVEDARDSASVLLEAHYVAGDYFFENDNVPHLPMRNLPWFDETTSALTSQLELEMLEEHRDAHSKVLQEIIHEFPHLLNEKKADQDRTGRKTTENKKVSISDEVADDQDGGKISESRKVSIADEVAADQVDDRKIPEHKKVSIVEEDVADQVEGDRKMPESQKEATGGDQVENMGTDQKETVAEKAEKVEPQKEATGGEVVAHQVENEETGSKVPESEVENVKTNQETSETPKEATGGDQEENVKTDQETSEPQQEATGGDQVEDVKTGEKLPETQKEAAGGEVVADQAEHIETDSKLP